MNRTVSLKKNALLNVIKKFLQIAFPLITFPYISRVLGTENYGKYNFSLSIISYFTLFAGMGTVDYAIREGARIRDDRVRLEALISQVFTVNMLFTVLSYGCLALLTVFWKKLHSYELLLIVQSATILFVTLGAEYINIIFEDYAYITIRYIAVKTVSLVLMFLLVKKSEDYVLYAGIVTGAEILANIINLFYIKRYCSLRLTASPGIRQHLLPMFMLFVNSLAIIVYSNSDVIMLGIFTDDSTVGIYSLASKVYQIAKSMLSAVLTVMIPRLAWHLRDHDRKEYNRLLNKTMRTMLAFVVPIVIGFIFLSREIIWIVGGEGYRNGNEALRILMIALFPASVASVFQNAVLIVNRREKYCLIATLVSAGINILLNLMLLPIWGATGAAATTLAAELVNCVMCVRFSRSLYENLLRADQDTVSVILGGALIAGTCILCRRLLSGTAFLICSIGISALLYCLVLYLMGNSTFHLALEWLRRKTRKA